MPRPRFLKLSPERRGAILAAARAEFVAHGFEGASTNRIIERLGTSKGAMYYYFDDKLDLFVTVLEEIGGEMTAALGLEAGWPREGDFWEVMRDVSTRAWRFAIAHPELGSLFKGIGLFPPQARQQGRLGELWRSWRELTRESLRIGQEQGQVRTDLPLPLLTEVSMALDEAIDLWLVEHVGELSADPVEQVVEVILDLWRRLLAPP